MPDPRGARPDRMAGIIGYTLPGGWAVLAGRTDEANDYLSIKLARPDDRWFHIRGMPGSHVLMRVPPGTVPDRETLERAAGIAAFHSKARDAGTVAVSCTEARNVSKPRGVPRGTVTIKKEIVLKVRPISAATAAEWKEQSDA